MRIIFFSRRRGEIKAGERRRSFLESVGDESGQGLVEVAMAVSLCGMIVLGAAEFGRLAYAGIEVSNAAHAGAQYGSETHTTASDSANMKLAATQDAPDVTSMTATATYYCQCASGAASTCAATDCSTSRIIEYVKVNTTAKVDPTIYVPGLPKTYTVTGQAIMRVVQ